MRQLNGGSTLTKEFIMAVPKGVNKKQSETKTVGRFSIGPWKTENVGERIQIYGSGGVGKSTLASLANNEVIIPLSDGSRELYKADGNKVNCVQTEITSFQMLRDMIIEPGLWDGHDNIILDDTSELEILAEQYVIDNYPTPAKKGKVTSLRQFGYDGAGYLVEVIRLILNDLDTLVYQGKNVVLISHERLVKIAAAEGFDYVEGGPDLQHNSQYSVRNTVYNWCDHIVQIDFAGKIITKDKDEKRGKIEADDERVVFTRKSVQYLRKSRQLKATGKSLPSEISFTDPADDSFWKFVGGCEVA